MYTYFVSYSHPQGFGNAKVDLLHPLDSLEAVKSVARWIEDTVGYGELTVVVLNFQLMKRSARG